MTLYDKVKSILTIPDKNSNDSIVNATDLYLEWEKGDGQYLLPLLLIFVIFFCITCGVFQALLSLVVLCIRSLCGFDEEDENFNINGNHFARNSTPSEHHEEIGNLMGTEAASISELPQYGTPRTRKSNTSSSQNRCLSV
ncbi:Small integral membrane protein [Caenorhabditis elegans]|uniref:Small integral membrane protein n=1 Tax=Caenorhabditis elegans TaxID=6239 RepID=B0M0M4_CAEEL|nr:Small integral membrane protein [Caenorhabditis elegans]CAP72368.2 Small integral membrane protein [Caenorhabditis elegans]